MQEWVHTDPKFISFFCNTSPIACAQRSDGSIRSIYSQQEASEITSGQCNESIEEHELKHLEGYDHK